MKSEDRTNHVLDAIDGALEDWSISGDAMRWSPESEKPAFVDWSPGRTGIPPAALSGPIVHHTGVPSWLRGMRVIEDPGVAPGEVALSVDRELGEAQFGLATRMYVTSTTVEARIEVGLTPDARAALIARMADHYGVPPCLIEHEWTVWRSLSDPLTYRRYCVREGCDAWEDQHGGGGGLLPRPGPPSTFTCPICRMTSHNPNDVREGFCGNCHDWTGIRP